MAPIPKSSDSDHSPAWQLTLDQIQRDWPCDRFRDVGVVVGVSGGADSVCLLRAIAQLRNQTAIPPGGQTALLPGGLATQLSRGFVVVGHFNHGLRGEDSDRDQQFVSQLAADFGFMFATHLATDPVSDEASMSRQRMKFLIDTAKHHGARYITLAHSRDDNVETVLHHLFRGTGPAGLAGIGQVRSLESDLVLIRPLLGVDRQTIRNALTQIGQVWREDASNQSAVYSRNWIRGELLPLIQTRYPDAADAIARAIDGQRRWRTTIAGLAEAWTEQQCICHSPATFRRGDDDPSVIVAALQELWRRKNWPRQAMTADHWSRLAECLIGTTDERFSLPGNLDVIASGNRVSIRQEVN